jgi:prepilin-type N-terminal cleavage/methylation domain-containing protein
MLRVGRMSGNNSRGFTLLELIVVLIIISLVSAFVAPKLTGPLSNLDLKTASKNISSSLRYMRSHAAAEKTTCAALFDLDRNRLVLASSAASALAREDFPIGNREAFDGALAAPPDNEKARRAQACKSGIQGGRFQFGSLPDLFFPRWRQQRGGDNGGQ